MYIKLWIYIIMMISFDFQKLSSNILADIKCNKN